MGGLDEDFLLCLLRSLQLLQLPYGLITHYLSIIIIVFEPVNMIVLRNCIFPATVI
jgi:hypothetical protein